MDQKQTIGIGLAVAVVVAVLVILTTMLAGQDPAGNTPASPTDDRLDASVSSKEPGSVDDVASSIVSQGAADDQILDEEVESANAVLADDSQSIDNFDQVYDENEF